MLLGLVGRLVLNLDGLVELFISREVMDNR